MKEIFQTNSPVEIALLRSLFETASITAFFFDEYTNAILGGWSPCRVMVSSNDYEDALNLLDNVERNK